MNPSHKLLCGALFWSALVAPLQVAESAVAYTNSLKDGAKVVADFTDYSTINSDYIDRLTGGWFLVDSNNGLTLLSVAPNYEDGIAAYNRLLTASNDWTITVQAHLSQFSNNQTNPFYTVGMSLVKTSSIGLEYPNRLDLGITRSGVSGSAMTNFIVSSLYVNDGESLTITNRNIPDAYLQFRYLASNRTVSTAYSTNGSNYFTNQSYNLSKIWGLKVTDGLTLGLAASDQPYSREIPNYSVTAGQMYLKNLKITSPTAPSNSVSGGSVSGGTLNLGNNNTGGIGVVTVNLGGLNSYYAGWPTNAGSGPLVYSNAYTNVGGAWVVNTNVLTGGGVTNGGSNSISIPNVSGSGTNSNSPVGLPTGGGINLPGGAIIR